MQLSLIFREFGLLSGYKGLRGLAQRAAPAGESPG